MPGGVSRLGEANGGSGRYRLSAELELCHDRPVVGPRFVLPFAGLVRDGRHLDLGRRHRFDALDQRVGHQQVIDQLAAAPVDAGEALLLRDQRGQGPQPLPIALVGL